MLRQWNPITSPLNVQQRKKSTKITQTVIWDAVQCTQNTKNVDAFATPCMNSTFQHRVWYAKISCIYWSGLRVIEVRAGILLLVQSRIDLFMKLQSLFIERNIGSNKRTYDKSVKDKEIQRKIYQKLRLPISWKH